MSLNGDRNSGQIPGLFKFLERYQKGQKDKQYFQNAHQTK